VLPCGYKSISYSRWQSEPAGQPVTWGAPHDERADAACNRLHLLATARQMLSE
jgi:hypothetical protein